jgi:protein-serine/threonine kinase
LANHFLLTFAYRTIKDRTKIRSATVDAKKDNRKQEASAQELEVKPMSPSAPTAALPTAPADVSDTPTSAPSSSFVPRTTTITGVSTLSAKNVMNWFRLRSLGKRETEPVFVPVEKPVAGPGPPLLGSSYVGGPSASSSSTIGQPEPESDIQVVVTNPQNQHQAPTDPEELRSPMASRSLLPRNSGRLSRRMPSESGSRGIVNMVRNATAPKSKYDATSLRIHHGAVDHMMITSGAPPVVFARVTKILQAMGLEIQRDSEFKYRCIRPKKGGVSSVAIAGSAASNGVRRVLNIPFFSFCDFI